MKAIEAAVIGTVFTDIKGFASSGYEPRGRNMGSVDISQGGVGRNVAENLANLGVNVSFISSVDMGMLGSGVLSRLASLDIDTGYVKTVPAEGMGIWLLINDENGEQAGLLSQLPDPSHIEDVLDSCGDDIIANAENIILEADVSAGVTSKVIELAGRYGKKIYSLPATMGVVMSDPQMISSFECFILNDIEAGQLFHTRTKGLEPRDMLEVLMQGMRELNARSMVVTMGERGAVYCDMRTGECGHMPALKVDVVDSSGAGDAFFSGAAAALMRGAPLGQAVVSGTRLAALTIQCVRCNCDADVVKNAGIL